MSERTTTRARPRDRDVPAPDREASNVHLLTLARSQMPADVRRDLARFLKRLPAPKGGKL